MALVDIPIAESSNIKSIQYDVDAQTLVVAFKAGGVYQYDGVSQDKADGFASADSAGKYLHTFIKGAHQHTKIG